MVSLYTNNFSLPKEFSVLLWFKTSFPINYFHPIYLPTKYSFSALFYVYIETVIYSCRIKSIFVRKFKVYKYQNLYINLIKEGISECNLQHSCLIKIKI